MSQRSIVVEIDPAKLRGVYDGVPGHVSIYDGSDELTFRREATQEEALTEQWVQRLEVAMCSLGNAIRGGQ